MDTTTQYQVTTIICLLNITSVVKSLYYNGIKIYNSLPSNIKIMSLNQFKKHVSRWAKGRDRKMFLEPVPRTLKNPIFCRVLGTSSGNNPKFEKGFQNQFLGTLNL
jgi:hypothetical protein